MYCCVCTGDRHHDPCDTAGYKAGQILDGIAIGHWTFFMMEGLPDLQGILDKNSQHFNRALEEKGKRKHAAVLRQISEM